MHVAPLRPSLAPSSWWSDLRPARPKARWRPLFAGAGFVSAVLVFGGALTLIDIHALDLRSWCATLTFPDAGARDRAVAEKNRAGFSCKGALRCRLQLSGAVAL